MKLKTKLEDLSSVKKKLFIEIPAADAGVEFAKAVNEFRKFARIPGFRPGKAPLPLVKSRFKEDLKGEVYKKLVPEAYDQAIEEKALKPVGQPDLENLKGEEGEAISFEAVFEIRPKIELPEYKGLDLEVEDEEISDADVETRLEALRESHAQLVAVENRPIQDKDVVIINMKGAYLDGREAGDDEEEISKEGLTVTVGDERTLPEFTENLRGLKNGDEATFEIEYEKEYPAEELAGRKVRYRIEVTEIKAPELPDLNDEFVKELGSYESLAEFKAELKAEMTRNSAQNRENMIRNLLVEKLVESSEFEIPSVMVEARLDERLKDFAGRLISQGVNPEQANFDWAAYRESMRPGAEKDVRATLLLERIAEQEALSVSDEDVDTEIAGLAENYSQPVERVRQLLLKDGNLEGLKDDLLRRKVFDFLIKEARIASGKGEKSGKTEKKAAKKAKPAAKKAEKPTAQEAADESSKSGKAGKAVKSVKTEKE